MSVTELIHQDKTARRFSFEVLPPLKGTGTDKLFADIDKLREFDPAYINITTHHSEELKVLLLIIFHLILHKNILLLQAIEKLYTYFF